MACVWSCIIATFIAIEKVGLLRSEVLIIGSLELRENLFYVSLQGRKKVGILFNEAIVLNLKLFSDLFQCNIWSATFYKTLDFDVQTT